MRPFAGGFDLAALARGQFECGAVIDRRQTCGVALFALLRQFIGRLITRVDQAQRLEVVKNFAVAIATSALSDFVGPIDPKPTQIVADANRELVLGAGPADIIDA